MFGRKNQVAQVVEQEQEQQPVQSKTQVQMVNSPWILLLAPLIGGCVWLASNTWVITNNLDKPYTLYAGPATIGSILLGWCVVKFFTAIVAWCKAAWQAFQRARKEDGSAQFFWIVIIVFMVVSVFSSGAFFTTIEHNALPGLGYATALFIDLVAVQSMRARLNAVRMRDKKGAALYLFGVLVCAGASAFANVYTSLSDFSAQASHALPIWMNSVAPWFGLVFPLLILLLSITADYTIDQVSTKLDPEQYREQEAKRTKLLEYQRDALKTRVSIEHEIDVLTAQLQNKKEKRVFFLINWLFPAQKSSTAHLDDIKTQGEELAQKTEYLYRQMTQLHAFLSSQLATIAQQHDDDFALIYARFQETNRKLESFQIGADLGADLAPFSQQTDAPSVANEMREQMSNWSATFDTEERETVADVVANLATPRPKITVKLDDILERKERNTDQLATMQARETSKVSTAENEALKKVRRMVRRNKDIRPVDIADKVNISRQYASKLKAQVLAEMPA